MSGFKAWFDGRLLEPGEPALPLDDHGFTTGDAVFETMKVVGGVPFALTRHLARLRRSCEGMGIEPPPEPLLRGACAAVVAANGPGVGRLRITVTAGRAPLGSSRGGAAPSVAVVAGPPAAWPPTTAVCVCPWVRNERSAVAGLKTTSYAENVVALAWAAERGCSEALFANTRGELCEGTGTNVFVALGGRLVTPPLSSGCLAGVTRDLLVAELGVTEEPIPIEALAEADEVFLTSSTRDVHPVHALDGRALPAPGPLTEQAMAAWKAIEARSLDP